MITAHETFDDTFPYAPHFSSAPGFAMHYADEGAGPVLLCLHGEPTWGYLFRHLIAGLRGSYRMVVPDHMGFGKSETPPGRTYWLQDHIDNLEALVLDLRLSDITLVMHDFGGPVGMGLLARRPELVSRVVALNAPTPFGQPELPQALAENTARSPWFGWIARAQADGTLDDVLGALGYNVLSTLKLNGFQDNTVITPAWIRAYATAFPTREQTLGALGWARGFALGTHRFASPSPQAREAAAHLPALTVWGMQDQTLRAEHFLPLFHAAFPHGLATELPTAGHYSPEDAPEAVLALVRLFLDATASRSRPTGTSHTTS
ncbi:alpha/beta fold hydrolase [Streptomyces sp. NBC_01483]|uniref:alpha/beta fold hydrolase n=1 Tax=Streptomyces sp. NBC_01483 TaxID=2903883 RepID=UPI002E2F2377|nr:alpha/beta fold hydrolase [Streptomyces sp. NBC_01483]